MTIFPSVVNKLTGCQFLNKYWRYAGIQPGEVKLIQCFLEWKSCCLQAMEVLVFLPCSGFCHNQIQQQIAEIPHRVYSVAGHRHSWQKWGSFNCLHKSLICSSLTSIMRMPLPAEGVISTQIHIRNSHRIFHNRFLLLR